MYFINFYRKTRRKKGILLILEKYFCIITADTFFFRLYRIYFINGKWLVLILQDIINYYQLEIDSLDTNNWSWRNSYTYLQLQIQLQSNTYDLC